MEFKTLEYLALAIEDIEDYIPLLPKQDKINQLLVQHSILGLKQTLSNYKQTLWLITQC